MAAGGQWREWPRMWGVGGWQGLHHTGPQSSFNFMAAVTSTVILEPWKIYVESKKQKKQMNLFTKEK